MNGLLQTTSSAIPIEQLVGERRIAYRQHFQRSSARSRRFLDGRNRRLHAGSKDYSVWQVNISAPFWPWYPEWKDRPDAGRFRFERVRIESRRVVFRCQFICPCQTVMHERRAEARGVPVAKVLADLGCFRADVALDLYNSCRAPIHVSRLQSRYSQEFWAVSQAGCIPLEARK